MDEDEVQIWYEDEKQKLLDAYTEELSTTKNKKKSEDTFNKQMDNLSKKYYKKMDAAIKSQERQVKIMKKVKRVKEMLHLEKKKKKDENQ